MKQQNIMVTRTVMPPYEEYIEAIKPLWDSHWVTNMGCYHRQLEEKLQDYLQVPKISLLVNGHMSLELTLQAMDFPKGAEVITTPFTFISTTHAIVRNGLIPVFCDVKETDGTIDETKIETLITEKTAAILPVHVYGNICNVEKIQEIADKYGIKVIYDAAHAFGEYYKGIGVGNYGDASIFSFHATKIFNTIEGGAVAFSAENLYDKLYNLKNFGIQGEELVTEVGANAKMNEFSAIMGLCNLNHIDEVLSERKKRVCIYKELLQEVQGIRSFDENPDTKCNYAYLPILIEDTYVISRDKLFQHLREKGIYARKYFYPLTLEQECYRKSHLTGTVRIAGQLAKQVLVLPLYDTLAISDIERIAGYIKNPMV